MRCCPAVVLLGVCLANSLTAEQTSSTTARDKAAALGAQLAVRVRAQTTPLRIDSVNEYVAGLGRRLATEIPTAPPQWHFTVVKQPGNWAHEPLGFPGGHVFVPAALIVSAKNEAEFAAMLARSMIQAASPAFAHWNGATIPLL